MIKILTIPEIELFSTPKIRENVAGTVFHGVFNPNQFHEFFKCQVKNELRNARDGQHSKKYPSVRCWAAAVGGGFRR